MKRYKVHFNTEFIILYEGDVVVGANDRGEAIDNAIERILDNLIVSDVENIGSQKWRNYDYSNFW